MVTPAASRGHSFLTLAVQIRNSQGMPRVLPVPGSTRPHARPRRLSAGLQHCRHHREPLAPRLRLPAHLANRPLLSGRRCVALRAGSPAVRTRRDSFVKQREAKNPKSRSAGTERMKRKTGPAKPRSYSARVAPEVTVNCVFVPGFCVWPTPEVGWPPPTQTSTTPGTTLRMPESSTRLKSRS